MMSADLVVAGHVCLDIAPEFGERHTFREVFSPGRLSQVGKANISTGGAVANTGLAAHRFGLRTVLMSKVGADSFGAIIKQILDDSKAQTAIKESSEVSTSYSVVLNLPGKDRIFLHHPGANDHFYASDLDYELIQESRIFHLGYPPLMATLFRNNGEELVKIMAKIKEAGVTISLDMAMPDPNAASGEADWDQILRRIGPYVDVFLPSYEELYLMLEKEDYLRKRDTGKIQDFSDEVNFALVRDFASRLQKYGMGIVVIKAGRNGIYLRTPGEERLATMKGLNFSSGWEERELWAESRKPSAFISTTGAGDCAVAGFLAALLREFNPEDCAQAANVAGYQNLRAVDAVSGLGSWSELVADLHDVQAEYHELSLAGYGLKRVRKGLWGS